jgi:hypothetical protein
MGYYLTDETVEPLRQTASIRDRACEPKTAYIGFCCMGNINQYVAFKNNPVNFRDPSGLCPEGGDDSYDWRKDLWNHVDEGGRALRRPLDRLAAMIRDYFRDDSQPRPIPELRAYEPDTSLLMFVGGIKMGPKGGGPDSLGNAVKRLSNGEINQLIRSGNHPHDLKPNSKYDLFKDVLGNISVRPKSGVGPGEPTGLNINHLP